MNRIGSTGNKSRTSRNSQKRAKSASKSRNTLINSREVYYLVLKYEQDDITKKLIENQEILRSSSRAKCIMENEFEIEEDKKSSRRNSKQSSLSKEKRTKTQEEGLAGYSDESFDDERECALQSVMTSHSDHLKEEKDQASAEDAETRDNPENDAFSRNSQQRNVNSSQRKSKTESANAQNDEEDNRQSRPDSVHFETSHKNDSQITSKRNSKDIPYESDPSYNKDDHSGEHYEILPDDYKPEEKEEERGSILKDKNEANVSGNEDSSSCYSDQDECSSDHQAKTTTSELHSKYDERHSSSEYSSRESASLRSTHVESKPPKKVVLAGLPPRKPLALLTTKGDPKKNNISHEMKRVVQEVIRRGDSQIKDLTVEAQNLRRTTQVLSEENRALKKLQKIQAKEIQEVDQFISMTGSRSKVARQDVRDTEMTSIDIDNNIRKQVKELLQLRKECERYEKLIEMDRKIPRRSVLEERLEKAERQLQSRDKEIEVLNKKVVAQQKKVAHERQKENKKFAQLDEEINGTMAECDEIKLQLKDAERRIDKTNIYCRRNTPSQKAFPQSATLPALPWHPPVRREKTKVKVKKWLNDSNNKHIRKTR